MIYNIISKKYYIGSAYDLYQRAHKHIGALNRKKFNPHLVAAWHKYGANTFEFHSLELCDKNTLLEREQWYLDTFRPWDRTRGYNKSKLATSNKGVTWDENQKSNHSKIWTEISGKEFTIVDPNGNVYTDKGVAQFTKKHKLPKGAFCRVLSGLRSHTNGWHLPGVQVNRNKYRPKIDICTLSSPEGIIHEISWQNIDNFCQEHNLCKNHLRDMWFGVDKHIQGWTRTDKHNEFIEMIDPQGNRHRIKRVIAYQLAKQHNIRTTDWLKVVKGERKSCHGGWKLATNN